MNSLEIGFFIHADFKESSIRNKYHGKWYSEGSWSNIIDQNFEIRTDIYFTGKDIRTAIRKDKHSKNIIQELSYTNQWRIYSLNYFHEGNFVHIFLASPIGELAVETLIKNVE